jgi:hypothetical protein
MVSAVSVHLKIVFRAQTGQKPMQMGNRRVDRMRWKKDDGFKVRFPNILLKLTGDCCN